MSSASPTRILVSHTYSTDHHLPSKGEVLVVRLSQDLFGPGSTLGSARDLPSRVTPHNYHHAVVIEVKLDVLESIVLLTVFPMPAYSAIDPISGLSSTSWLLSQPADFQKLHIPIPYEQTPSLTHLHPPFPTPAEFSDPIEMGGWKDCKSSWIQVVPQVTQLKYTTKFKCFEPPVKLSSDEFQRLKVYSGLPPSPVIANSSAMPPFPLCSGNGAPDASSSAEDTVPGSGSSQHPGQDSSHGRVGFGAGGSFALQSLYATDAVKQAFMSLSYRNQPALILDSDEEDNSDDNDDWEDRMDPITFARYYAAQNPHLAKIVQDHDDKMRIRLNEGIVSWLEGTQPGSGVYR